MAFIALEIVQSWIEQSRVDSMNVVVEAWDGSLLVDTMLVKIYIGFKSAAKSIQISTVFCISWIPIFVKLSRQ